jgi:anthranilate phosphoribosyltransferase
MARDMQDGLDIAKEALATKKAKKKLEEIIEISNKL